MAGAIPRTVHVVNRTTARLEACFDGQPVALPPGYKVVDEEGNDVPEPGDAVRDEKELKAKKWTIVGAGRDGRPASLVVPYFAAEMIMRQHPIMGTEDPTSPRDFESLIGIAEWESSDISHVEQSDATERLDREMLSDEAQKARPQGTAQGRRAAKNKKRGKGGRSNTDERLRNPGGIRADYND